MLLLRESVTTRRTLPAARPALGVESGAGECRGAEHHELARSLPDELGDPHLISRPLLRAVRVERLAPFWPRRIPIAKALGVSRTTLHRRLRELGLSLRHAKKYDLALPCDRVDTSNSVTSR
jgi:DNA-binding NtrC family response regulator